MNKLSFNLPIPVITDIICSPPTVSDVKTPQSRVHISPVSRMINANKNKEEYFNNIHKHYSYKESKISPFAEREKDRATGFHQSSCHHWISAHNVKNDKTHYFTIVIIN